MAALCPPEELLRPGDLKALAGGLLGTHHQGPCGASHGAQTGGLSASNNATPRAPTHTPHHRRPSTVRPRHQQPPSAAQATTSPARSFCLGVREARMQKSTESARGIKPSRVEPRKLGALAYPTLRQNRGRTHDIRHEARPGPSARSAPINAVDHVVYIIGSRFDRQYPASPGHRRADAHGPE